MTMFTTSGSWHVGRTAGRCAACGLELQPGMECWAALCDGGDRGVPEAPPAEPEPGRGKKDATAPQESPFVRVDFCEKCWAEGRRPDSLPPPAGSPAGEPPAPLERKPLEMFSFWKTTVPIPQQKKKLLVDDAVLVDVFSRMEGKQEPQEIRFRFVLALILMRKRLLKYEGMEEVPPLPGTGPEEADTFHTPPPAPPPPEIWRMLPRGEGAATVHVINPHLTAEQISEVSQQLSAILAEEV